MVSTVFIDGEAGTTGLQIHERLVDRPDVKVLQLGAQRKDLSARWDALNSADIAILCLPDDAARDAVAMIETGTRVIDASTAHRVSEGWIYGMPELTFGHSGRIAKAARVANVGCYATGSIALLRPLIERGVLPRDAALSLNAISGYTGGGKALIAEMEAADAPPFFLYAMDQAHKHLPEIQKFSALKRTPVFQPSVGAFAQGMIVSLPLHADMLPEKGAQKVEAAFKDHYADAQYVMFENDTAPRLSPEMHNGTNTMSLHLRSSKDGARMIAFAILDNLGKGASGSAVQNLDLMIGA